MNNIAILTAFCGAYELENPSIIHDGVDYIAFTDKKTQVNETIWNINKAVNFTFDRKFKNRRNAKIYKIFAPLLLHEYEYIIWVDNTHEVKAHPSEIISRLKKDSDIAVFRHFKRSCIYQEAKEVVRLYLDDSENVDRQMEFYKLKGYPENNGLFELPCFLIRNTNNTKLMALSWWENISRFSSRDQLSFPFVLWKHKLKATILEGDANALNKNEFIPKIRL